MSFAWLGALVIGLSLGLLGSGGSILTVPVLIYWVGELEKVAIAESLAIVGFIAASGALPYARKGLVEWRLVGWFGIPGMVGAHFGAVLGGHISATLQLTLFAIIMLAAAMLMFRPPRLNAPDAGPRPERKIWKTAIDGLLVGLITGLVGVGGGFLIVPALVLLGGLPMLTAVGTSLAIIALNSLVGYLEYLDVLQRLGLAVQWQLIGVFAVLGAMGAWVGRRLAGRLPQAQLRRVFAVFLVAMSLFIFYRNGVVPGSPAG